MSPSTWTISELAREFDVTPRTIRFYEDQGIVSPAREGRNRIFGPRDRTRLKLRCAASGWACNCRKSAA